MFLWENISDTDRLRQCPGLWMIPGNGQEIGMLTVCYTAAGTSFVQAAGQVRVRKRDSPTRESRENPFYLTGHAFSNPFHTCGIIIQLDNNLPQRSLIRWCGIAEESSIGDFGLRLE